MNQDDSFADYSEHPDLLQEMKQLESKMRERMGEQINLIGYVKEDAAADSTTGCRAGLED